MTQQTLGKNCPGLFELQYTANGWPTDMSYVNKSRHSNSFSKGGSDCWTLEYGTDRLSRNVCNYQCALRNIA